MEERIIAYYTKSGDSIEIPEETIHEYHITPEDDREAFIDEIYPNFSAQVEVIELPEEWGEDSKGYFHSILGEIEANPEDYDIEFTDDEDEEDVYDRLVSELSWDEFEKIMDKEGVESTYSTNESLYAAAVHFGLTINEAMYDCPEVDEYIFEYGNKRIMVVDYDFDPETYLDETRPNWKREYYEDRIQEYKTNLNNDTLWDYIDEDKLIDSMSGGYYDDIYEIYCGTSYNTTEVNGMRFEIRTFE